MTPRERLAAVLAPDVLAALEELVVERVAELAPATENGSPWLGVDAAAGYLGVSRATVERAVARGRLRSSTVGRRRLVHRDDLDDYVRGGAGGDSANHSTAPPRGV